MKRSYKVNGVNFDFKLFELKLIMVVAACCCCCCYCCQSVKTEKRRWTTRSARVKVYLTLSSLVIASYLQLLNLMSDCSCVCFESCLGYRNYFVYFGSVTAICLQEQSTKWALSKWQHDFSASKYFVIITPAANE